MTTRRIAGGLGAALIALAALLGSFAVLLEDQPPSESLDPHHTGVAVAGAFAGCLCIVALRALRRVSRGRARWPVASLWLALAVGALLVVDAVAFASRLGG